LDDHDDRGSERRGLDPAQLGGGAEPALQAGRLVGGELIGLLIGWGIARLLTLPK